MHFENIVRIGEKLVSVDRARRLLERVLNLRAQGLSQQEVARRLSLDRSFISRLEAISEVRKGKRVAVIGFPVENKDELTGICQELGLDFFLLMTNRERWELVEGKQALDFLNEVLELITRLREYEILVMATSERWYRLAEALLDCQILYVNLGPTPVSEDMQVDPERFRNLIEQLLKDRGRGEKE
ncbi:MAG TPA: transcriptional regulator [Bacillota bacterium]|jgi:transcriptional regulator with XRE-family HTH domain|nr:transcriptional regulator [Bacillota bacterium]HOJ84029.1 transcriptional regulator [Bacillota bacterium]HOL16282.1 transcriptional regulator [Bacillota bacterium]HPZ12401.1 transcriptional regulator [Bacillota bacterium]HQE10410.1 transcriptional regulator [Bacillota bacterium]